MTTTIKVISHNAPAMVKIFDMKEDNSFHQTGEQVVRVEDGEVSFCCTTTREISIVDLEPGHPDYEKKVKKSSGE